MIWDVDPSLVNIGVLHIRYYGVFFALGIFFAYLLWRWQMVRQGHPAAVAEEFVVWAVIAVLVGARLGHCLFYEPAYYLSQPWKIIRIWEGGLASHGAAILMVVAVYFFHRKHRISFLELSDCLAMAITMPIIMVRLGNFMNSEIVGRITDVPWAIAFPRFEMYHSVGIGQVAAALPLRHPSQLYEALAGLMTLGVLWMVDRVVGKQRPRGLLAAVFLVTYFTLRYFVEFTKEYQSPIDSPFLTMGQVLGTPFWLGGLVLGIWVWKKQRSLRTAL